MKNLLLSLLALLTTTTLFAQLYVSPNGSADSYVYVNDQVIFVEQDLNLVMNPTTDTLSSIYLRNDAQLIQGTSASSNSGTGLISVYQDSNSDSYDYNYWCSPVGRHWGPAGNTESGLRRISDVMDVTESVNTVITGGDNGSSSPLTISTRWFYYWKVDTQQWIPGGDGFSVPPGYGFTMKGTDVTAAGVAETQNQLYDFRGRPNNGTMILPVQTDSTALFSDGNNYHFTLAGNPYPSALDVYELFMDPENEEIESIRYWDEDRSINSHLYTQNEGGYGTWIPGPLINTTEPGGRYTRPVFLNYNQDGSQGGPTGVLGDSIPRRYAPIGQGFMIKAFKDTLVSPATIGDGFIHIKNEHRVYVTEADPLSMFRNNEGVADQIAPNPSGPVVAANGGYIVLNTSFGEDSHERELVLYFFDDSTDGFDRGMDASHPMDADLADAYFTARTDSNKHNLVIQTVPYSKSKMIPISFRSEEQILIKMLTTDEFNLPFQTAYLHDSLENTYYPITGGEAAEKYLEPGVYEDRFFIVFQDGNDIYGSRESESTENFLANVDFFQNNPQHQLEINNPEGYDIKAMNIFDMGGKLVLSRENVGNSRRLSFPTSTFSDGIYLVKLTTNDNLIVDYKITVFNK